MSDIIKDRYDKLNLLIEKGIDPFGAKFDAGSSIRAVLSDFKIGEKISVAGRLVAKRKHGKSIFCDIRDEWEKIQLYFNADSIGSDKFDIIDSMLDIGDIIGVSGELFRTRTNEPTIKTEDFTVLSKSLRPLPEKWHGLKDVETRYRQRYLDLIANPSVRGVFKARSEIIKSIRSFLDSKDYLEVETPMMQAIAGGANGKPFRTHHEALNADLYLRIAPELYLKRLLVGGFEKVYEINKSFRNEGISIRHNPEFTMLEVYTAYSDCQGTMQLAKELIVESARKVLGKDKIEYQGRIIDLTRWEEVSFAEIMKNSYDINPDDNEKDWIKKLRARGVEIESENVGRTQVANIIADLLTPKADHPIFVVDMFRDLCPLAKVKKESPLLTDRFELFMGGMEVANAYSELNNPIEQKERFTATAEGAVIDEDFIRALEYGMPPAGGLGIGIDRLVMLFTDSASIRDVILFPQLRKES